jgi:DNA-binding MarR family transcriptional regulator
MECGELMKQYLLSLQAIFRKTIRGESFTLSQMLILTSLPDDGLDMTSLAEKIGVDNSTATRLVGGMFRRNLIQKSKHREDKRITIITLTELGERASYEIEVKLDKIGEDVFRHIPLENQGELKEALLTFHWMMVKFKNSI